MALRLLREYNNLIVSPVAGANALIAAFNISHIKARID
jgi:hypothetical protein